MQVITVRNVCDALPHGVSYLLTHGAQEPSRAGPVLVAPYPVTTVYLNPQERVLFSPIRDANPFFHLAEALWMLAGRNDAAFLNLFVKDFGERFAEPDGRVHGAYGWRWRTIFELDQLEFIVDALSRDPTSRQMVLQMWDADVNPCTNDLAGKYWRDRPCNTHAYLRVRDGQLDLTVCCRSNDIIWGAYGSNAVHFSILQEYLAAKIGVGVGHYYQISNNYHAYISELARLCVRSGVSMDEGKPYPALASKLVRNDYADVIGGVVAPQRLVDDPDTFDDELARLLAMVDTQQFSRAERNSWKNRFLADTAYWMFVAYKDWRAQQDVFDQFLVRIEASDWRVACQEWVEQRLVKRTRRPSVMDIDSDVAH